MASERAPRLNLVLESVVVLGIARLTAHAVALTASAVRPLTLRERSIDVWPPQAPIAAWLERILAAPLERWDAKYYIRILAQGYSPNDGTLPFHPLYPVSALPAAWLGASPLVALLLAQATAAVLLVWALYRLARLDLAPHDARFATLACVLSPLAVALQVPYPEALFLLCAVLTFLWAKSGRWLLAGMAGALATLTRQQGLLLVLPLAWMAWDSMRDSGRVLKTGPERRAQVVLRGIALLAIPLTYGVWILYRAVVFGDLQTDAVENFQDLVYTVMVSPSAAEVVPVQMFVWPWVALGRAVHRLILARDIDLAVNLFGGVGFLVTLGFAWRGMDCSYRIYVLANTCVSFAYHTGPTHPYMGLLRHLLLGFPAFVGAATRFPRGWRQVVVLGYGLLAQLFLVLLYALEAWVP